VRNVVSMAERFETIPILCEAFIQSTTVFVSVQTWQSCICEGSAVTFNNQVCAQQPTWMFTRMNLLGHAVDPYNL